MGRRIEVALEAWLAAGRCRIGEITIDRSGDDYRLRHQEDGSAEALETSTAPEQALEIARYTAAGKYRPLKTEPTLRCGWELRLSSLAELVLALEYFYPAMLGSFRAAELGELRMTDLRETVGRQTGMYAITKKITREDAETVMNRRCGSEAGCLKRILWTIDGEVPRGFSPEKTTLETNTATLPLPCAEACNLLVAALRRHLKRQP